MAVNAVIFDLDGVIVSTDVYHYQAWKRLADEQGIYFDRKINERLRGVSRSESLKIILEATQKKYSEQEKQQMANRKNAYYLDLLKNLTEDQILPGVMAVLKQLKARGIKIAVASSSKNSPAILERIGLTDYYDAVADGNDITSSKPSPDVFLIAAERLGLAPQQCLVVEDAQAGVEAAIAAGMRALAIGQAANYNKAHLRAPDLASISVDEMLI